MITYARLDIPFDIQTVQNEVLSLPAQWHAHFNSAHYAGRWTAIALRSPGADGDRILPGAAEGVEYGDTPLLDKCPAIRALLARLQCPVMSVRLMNLEKGAIIKTHCDQDLAFEKGEVRLHFPVCTNEKVHFFANDALLKMKEGECWYVNVNLPHRVQNEGETDRIHLVVDLVVNDWVRELFGKALYSNIVADTVDPVELRAMITELRIQNTVTSHALADQLEGQIPVNWIPYKLSQEPAGTVLCEWLPVEGIPFTDPFFDETIVKARIGHAGHPQQSVSDLSMLAEWAGNIDSVLPSAFIFHVSRCGSTLVSQMLSRLSAAIVLAEVPFFDEILRSSLPVDKLLRAAISLYGRKRTGNERHLFIKTDSWHLFFCHQLRAMYPEVPFILLYRTPGEVIRSHEKRRGMQAVPGMIESSLLGLRQEDIEGADLDTYMASVLEKYYAQLIAIAGSDKNCLLLNYNEGAMQLTDKTLQFARIEIGEAERQDMLTRSTFNAKNGQEVFAAEKKDDDIPVWLQAAMNGYREVDKLRYLQSHIV
jgi:aspartyl/asparaginyl beta-hydroxylase